jgi:Reverse transcriptase (RNA-dependent DNA polymerase)
VRQARRASDASAVAQASATAGAWCKLLHLLPCLLLVPDGSLPRAHRFAAFTSGDLELLTRTALAFCRRGAERASARRARTAAEAAAAVRERAATTARQPGGVGRAARLLAEGANTSAPRDQATLAKLQAKHPAGDAAAELDAAAANARRAVTAAAALAAAAPVRRVSGGGEAASAAAGGVQPAALFTAQVLHDAILAANPGSAAGPSGLRNSHLQQCVRHTAHTSGRMVDWLLELMAWLGTVAYSTPAALPAPFWRFHAAARLSAVGEKARPIACGDTFRRLFARIFCASSRPQVSALLEPAGQFGVGARGGAERVALMAQLAHESGGVLLAIDGSNAFNALSRSAVLVAVAEHLPTLYDYVEHIYGPGRAPWLQFGLDGRADAAIILSQQGVQQGDPLGPLLFALALRGTMVAACSQYPQLALPGYLDDLTIMAPTCTAQTLSQVGSAFCFVQKALGELNIQVNVAKCAALVPAGGGTRERAAAAFAAAAVPVPVRDDGITLMGVPIGTAEFVRAHVTATLRAPGTDRLLAELTQMEDAQAAFSILRLAVPARVGHVARNTAPALAHEELRRFDAITLAAVATLAQEPSAGLAQPAREGIGDGGRGSAAGTAAAPPSPWAEAVAWIRDTNWGGQAPVALPAHQQVRVHLRMGSGGFGVLGAAPRACAAFVARTLECMQPALAAFPDAVRSYLLERARHRFTFTQLAACLQQLRGGGEDAAATISQLLPSAWCGNWAQDAAAWQALRHALGAGEAAEAGAQTRARARRGPGPSAAAREPDSAQAPPSSVLPRRQAALSRVLDAEVAAGQLRQLEAAGALEAIAAWRSGASKGGMSFLAQLPSTYPAESMSPPEFRETLRRHLGVERPAPAGAQCPKCHKPVESGAHLRRCTQGLNVTRHNLLADALYKLLQQVAHLRGLQRDTLAPFLRYRANHGFNKFMDIVFGSNQIDLPVPTVQPSAAAVAAGQCANLRGGYEVACCVDVTIRDSSCPSRLRQAQGGARDVQRVLDLASQEKIETYVASGALDPTTHTLFSAAFDHFGAMSRDTQALLRALAEHSSQGHYTAAQRIAFWRRRVSLALQRALTRVVIDNWNALVVPPDGDASIYRRMSLLQVPQAPPADAVPPAPPSD